MSRPPATLRFHRLSCALALAALLPATHLTAQTATAPARSLAGNDGVAEALEVARVWLEAERAYDLIPGVSAALVHDQELLWSGGFGEAHPETGVAATSGTLYSICSISKLFTSIAVMRLRDEGRLALSDPVKKHLPWFTLRQAHPGAPPPTVEGILTHSAGLPREADTTYWSAPDFPFPTREEIMEGVSRQETLYPAWQYFQYSNLGLTLAGELVSALSGQPYDAYVKANVLGPLGLEDTYPEMPEEHRGGQLASGHSALDRQGRRAPTPFYLARGIAPAAGYASTVDDLARFASWQFRLKGDAEEVLHAHTLQEMHRVHYVDPEWETFWGLGFAIIRHGDETFVGHGGSCPGYRSELILDTDDELGVVFMANASGVNTRKYVTGLYDLVAPRVKSAKEGEQTSTDADTDTTAAGPELDEYIGTYSNQPWGGETAVVRWDDGLALLSLPTSNPARALRRLRHIEGDTFRRIRGDDELGEAVIFLRDEAGRITGFQQHRNVSPRVR